MTTTAIADTPKTELACGMYEVEVERITPDPANLRQELGDMTGLCDSVRENGILQPLLLGTDGVLVCGHRRHYAAVFVGLATVPCIVREMSPAERVAAMLVENGQRGDLTPVEEAHGYQQLLSLGQAFSSVEIVAERCGMRLQRVKDRLALLALPKAVLAEFVNGGLGVANALLLAKLVDHPVRLAKVIESTRDEDDGVTTWRDVAHWVDRELKDIATEEKRQATIAKLPGGTKVIEWPGNYGTVTGHARVAKVSPGYGTYVTMDPKKHAKLTCHAVAVDDSAKCVEFCSKPKSHKADPPTPAVRRTAERKSSSNRPDYRATVEATTEARFEAMRRMVASDGAFTTVISDWLAEVADQFGFRVVEVADLVGTSGCTTFDELLAHESTDGFGDILLAMGLLTADGEIARHRNPFDDDNTRALYAWLEEHDYTLSEDETGLREAWLAANPGPREDGEAADADERDG